MADTSPWNEPAERVLALFRSAGPAAAFEYLDTLNSPDAGDSPLSRLAPGFREVAGVLYWQHRALPEFVALSQEVIRRLDETLATLTEAEVRANLVRPLGGCYYNLASFTWSGWGEADLRIGPEEAATGRQAALRCLGIREQPENSEVPFGYTLSMAHWVAGAHALPGDPGTAREHFSRAGDLDRAAGGDDALSRGYLALSSLIERPEDPAAAEAFEGVLSELAARAGDEDAAFFREQLLAARGVFLPPRT